MPSQATTTTAISNTVNVFDLYDSIVSIHKATLGDQNNAIVISKAMMLCNLHQLMEGDICCINKRIVLGGMLFLGDIFPITVVAADDLETYGFERKNSVPSGFIHGIHHRDCEELVCTGECISPFLHNKYLS